MTDAPWISALRAACETQGQAAVAKRIGYSAGAISSVLAGQYKASTRRIQTAVEGALMHQTVDCPLLGELPREACIRHQRRPFTPTNPTAVQLWRTCPSCPHCTTPRKEKAA